MSTSLKVVRSAAVCCASTRRRAIVARRFDMRSRVSRAPSARLAGSRRRGRGSAVAWTGACFASGACAAGCCALPARSTSAFVTRGPDDATDDSATSFSRAAFRAEGVAAVARRSPSSYRSFAELVGSPSFPSFPSYPSYPSLTEAPSSIVPSVSPIFTSAPAAWAIDFSTPDFGAATSTSTLSVSSSTSASPAVTASPSFFSHFATRASTMDSPTSGTTI